MRPTQSGDVTSRLQPNLSQLSPNFLTGVGPVLLDVIAQFSHVAFDVEFVLLEPGDVEFLAGCTALELTVNVFFVVFDDSSARFVSSSRVASGLF